MLINYKSIPSSKKIKIMKTFINLNIVSVTILIAELFSVYKYMGMRTRHFTEQPGMTSPHLINKYSLSLYSKGQVIYNAVETYIIREEK